MTQHLLSTELEAHRYTVSKLLLMAREGSLRIPPFQRPLRWRREDHLLLLDSLYRGYPVGTLLFWKRPAPPAMLIFGGFHVDAPKTEEGYWIVDGQQRISSLVGCFLHVDDPNSRRRPTEFAFNFDLDKDVFVAGGSEQSAPHLVPVRALATPVLTSKWARDAGISDQVHMRAQEVGDRLRSYEIPAYVTRAESDSVLRIVFERANTAGKRMRAEEIFEALNKGLSPSDSPEGLLERLRSVVQALDFGAIQDRVLQKALISVSGHNPKEDIPKALRQPGAAVEWEQKTADALRMTIEFLRDCCHIPHVRAMPYDLPLIVLPRFFCRFPTPKERSIELLTRWVWRGIATQTHPVTNQYLSPHYRALKAKSEEGVVQRILALVGKVSPSILPISQVFNLRGMKTKLDLAVAFRLAPIHLETGQRLSPSEIFDDTPSPAQQSIPGSHPPSVKRESSIRHSLNLPTLPGLADAKEQFAARFLHPALGSPANFTRLLQAASDDALRSHGVPSECWDAVRAANWPEVVTCRKKHIHTLVRETIAQLARWQEDDDAPSMDMLLSDSEQDGDV